MLRMIFGCGKGGEVPVPVPNVTSIPNSCGDIFCGGWGGVPVPVLVPNVGAIQKSCDTSFFGGGGKGVFQFQWWRFHFPMR